MDMINLRRDGLNTLLGGLLTIDPHYLTKPFRKQMILPPGFPAIILKGRRLPSLMASITTRERMPPSPDRAMAMFLRRARQEDHAFNVGTNPVVRLMLVDDHALVRMGLVALLQTVTGFQVVAEANDGAEALQRYDQHRPDVTLLDIRLPRQNGIDVLRQLLIRWPDARVIMLTTSDLDNDIEQAVEAGAAGYLLKNITRDELVNAIRQVHAGDACIPEQVCRRLAECRLAPRLTDREKQVLELLPKGLTNPDISRLLAISLHTTKAHLRTIFSKLDVVDRSEAITVAVQRGLLHLDE